MVARLTAQGLPARFAADVVELWSGVAAGELSAVTPAVRELTGRPPRTFDAFLAGRYPLDCFTVNIPIRNFQPFRVSRSA